MEQPFQKLRAPWTAHIDLIAYLYATIVLRVSPKAIALNVALDDI